MNDGALFFGVDDGGVVVAVVVFRCTMKFGCHVTMGKLTNHGQRNMNK